jgi:hypothetical protein
VPLTGEGRGFGDRACSWDSTLQEGALALRQHLPIELPAFDGGAGGLVIVTAEAGDFTVNLAEALPLLFGVGFGIDEGLGQFGEAGGQQGAELIAHELAMGAAAQGIGILVKVPDEFAGSFKPQPILVAALFPVGEILLGDGASLKVVAEPFLDDHMGVEPFDDLAARFAVFEAAADLIADGLGEAGDFAGAGGVHGG